MEKLLYTGLKHRCKMKHCPCPQGAYNLVGTLDKFINNYNTVLLVKDEVQNAI